MILEPETYDICRVKKFMKHLVLTSKRVRERTEQKEKVETQVEKVKKLSFAKAPKEKLSKEWAKLEKALKELVITNKTLVGVEQGNSMLLRKALEKIEKLSSSLSGAATFSQTKKSIAEDRLKELGEKFKPKFFEKDIELMEGALEKMKTPEVSSEIEEIEAQLALLEKKHSQLAKSGKHDKVALKKLEGMITGSKAKLNSMK